MANKTYKYTSDEFINYLRNDDPVFQNSFHQNLPDEELYRLGMRTYSNYADQVEPLTPIEKPDVDVSPGWFDSIPRYGIDENSPDFMKSAYANSLQGMLDLYEDGRLPFEYEEYDLNILEQLGAGIMGLAMPLDALTMFGGGGVVGAGIKKAATKTLGQKAFQKEISDKAFKKKALEALTSKGLDQTRAADIFNRMVGSGSQFAVYEGAKGGVGAALNGEDVKQGVFHGVVHGGTLGGVLGLTGGVLGNFYKELSAAKNIKAGTLFPKTPGLTGGAKAAETRTINAATNTNKYVNWSDDAIETWMKRTGPGSQFSAEVGVLTGAAQLDRYKQGEELTWGNLFNDAFFNIGFVGTMKAGTKAVESSMKAYRGWRDTLTPEEARAKETFERYEKASEEVSKSVNVEDATTPQGKAIADAIKKMPIEELKANDYQILRDKKIAIDEAINKTKVFEELIKDTEKMGTSELSRWKDKMGEVAEVLNGAELALDEVAKSGKPIFAKEEISQMRSDIQNYRKALNNQLLRKTDIKAEDAKAEQLEMTSLINFIKTEGVKQGGKGYKPTIVEEGVTREVPLKNLGELNLEQLQSIESSLVQAGTKRVQVVKEGQVPYENIKLDVESKGLLNKDIKSALPVAEKNIIIESKLGEVNKDILSYSADKLKTLRGTSKDATTQAKNLLEFSENNINYKVSDIRNLNEVQQKSLIADYINDYFGFNIINKKTGQALKESQILKYFKNDNAKTKHAMREVTRVINLLKEHFHQEGGIKDVIGFDLMKPQGKLLKGWQPSRIAQRELTITGGTEGLGKLTQWVKNNFKDYTSEFGGVYKKGNTSLMMEMATKGKMRPGEIPSATVKDIDVRAGTIEVKAPGKTGRTVAIGTALAKKLQTHAKKNKLKLNEQLFVKDVKQLNEVLKQVYAQAPKKLIPIIKDLYTGKLVPYDASLKMPTVKVGKLTLGGSPYTSRIQESSIFRRLFGDGGVDLGHAEGRGQAQARASYKKAGDAPPKSPFGKDIEPTTPPTKGPRRDAIETIEQAKDRHLEIAYKTKNKKTKDVQEKIAVEKDIILKALSEGEGAKFFESEALEILSRHKQTHIDALKDKNLDAKSVEFHKNWVKSYGDVAKTISKGFAGKDKVRLFNSETRQRMTIDNAKKIAYAARDYHIKQTGMWKKGMSKSEKSKIESKLIEESVVDAKKYNLKKISELNLEQVKELVDGINAREAVKPESKFAIREAKFFKEMSDKYKDLSRDDIALMLRDLGVKDGAVKNIRNIETFDTVEAIIHSTKEQMPKLDTFTTGAMELVNNPEVRMPRFRTTSSIWHGFAPLLIRHKKTEAIGRMLIDAEVVNARHKKLATETIESVMPKVKEAGFKHNEAYMFMFIDKKMYTGENAKFLSPREKKFIDMMNDKKPNPINTAVAEINSMYKRYWEKAKEVVISSDWASKMKQEDYINYLNQKHLENYYTKRVNPKVLDALLDRKGNVWMGIFNKNLDAEIAKMKRKTDKKGKFIETQDAFKLRKAEKRKDDNLRKKIEKDMDRFFFSAGTRVDFSFMKNRKFDLPRKIEIEVKDRDGNVKGMKEVNSYIEKFDAIVGYYGVGMSKLLTMLEYFPEFTTVGQKFGGGQLSTNMFKLMEGKNSELGVNAEWANFIKMGLENYLGLGGQRGNVPLKRNLGIISSTSAAIGLSSPTSGLKNLAIGIPRSIGHFGYANTLKALYRFATNNEDLMRRDLNWVKDYGSKQLVLEAQETAFERLPFIGHKLTMDNLFTFNAMTKTEGINRIVSSYAGNMAFEQMNAAYHGRGKTGMLMMGGKKEILRTYKDVWKLSEKEIKYITETPYENLNTKNKKLMDFITLKVQAYSHIATQGSTSAALLPKWMSNDYARPLTLFQRMAWSTTNDIATNYLKPLRNFQNPMPILRATLAHGLTGAALYKFYEKIMGYEVPEQLRDNTDIRKWLPYLWRSEFFGLFGEFFNPHSSHLYDKNKGFLDLFGSDATQSRGLLEPVIIRNAAVLLENGSEILKAVAPFDFGGKQTKLARQAVKDLTTQSIVVTGQLSRIYDNYRSSDLKSHRKLKHVSREFMKLKGKTFPRAMIQNFRAPYYRDLKDSFWHKNEQEWARTYWNAYNYIVTEYQNEGYHPHAAHKKAKTTIKQSLSYMNPVKQFSEDSKGRVISKKAEYLNFLKKNAPDKYKEALRLEKEFEFRMRKIESIVGKYQKRYSVFPMGPKAKYTGKYFGIY